MGIYMLLMYLKHISSWFLTSQSLVMGLFKYDSGQAISAERMLTFVILPDKIRRTLLGWDRGCHNLDFAFGGSYGDSMDKIGSKTQNI